MDVSDPKQIKKQKVRVESQREQELNDIRVVLSNKSGRRFVWRLMEYCKPFESVFSENSMLMSRYCGMQDVGHHIMTEIVAADENLLFKMMKANKDKTQGDTNG